MLFILSFVLFVLSTLFVLPLKSEKVDFEFRLRNLKKMFKGYRLFFIPEVIDNLAEDAMVLWSILIFLILQNFIDVGFVVGTVFISLGFKIFTIPYGSIIYNSARQDDVHFLVLREVPTALGRQILFLIALIFHDNLPVVFLVVAVFFSYFLFFNTRRLEI